MVTILTLPWRKILGSSLARLKSHSSTINVVVEARSGGGGGGLAGVGEEEREKRGDKEVVQTT